MIIDITLHWFLVYILTLFLFDISPGVSFVITAKNTIKNKSLKLGLFTALGVASSDGVSALIGFFCCALLNKHHLLFQYAQMVGMSYLLYVGIKMMTTKQKEYTFEDAPSTSRDKLDAYKSGFLYTFSNIGVATVIITVISQFYQYVNSGSARFGLIMIVPVISFATFALIAFCCYFLKLWWLFGKKAYMMDRISGFIIIILATTNIKSILGTANLIAN